MKLKTNECPICLTNIQHVVVTDCNHRFCDICLIQHLLMKPNCPICRNFIYRDEIVDQIKNTRVKTIMRKIDNFVELHNETQIIERSETRIVSYDMSFRTYILRSFVVCFRIYIIYCIIHFLTLTTADIIMDKTL